MWSSTTHAGLHAGVLYKKDFSNIFFIFILVNEAEDMSSSFGKVKRDGKAAASPKVKAKKGKPVVLPKTEAKAAPVGWQQ